LTLQDKLFIIASLQKVSSRIIYIANAFVKMHGSLI
jgi:hypothetical protein